MGITHTWRYELVLTSSRLVDKAIGVSFIQLFQPLFRRFRSRGVSYDEANAIEEPCLPEELVPVWMWGGGIGEYLLILRSPHLK